MASQWRHRPRGKCFARFTHSSFFICPAHNEPFRDTYKLNSEGMTGSHTQPWDGSWLPECHGYPFWKLHTPFSFPTSGTKPVFNLSFVFHMIYTSGFCSLSFSLWTQKFCTATFLGWLNVISWATGNTKLLPVVLSGVLLQLTHFAQQHFVKTEKKIRQSSLFSGMFL